MGREFEVAPLGKATQATALVLGIGLPLMGFVMSILKSPPGPLDWLIVAQATFGCALVAVPLLSALGRRRIALADGRLRVEATWFTRESPVGDFRLDEARVLDLGDHPRLRPLLRTLGLSLPRLRTGHYRTRGWQRAFCLVSDPSRVLVLPHADGRLWLLSAARPQALLDALRQGQA